MVSVHDVLKVGWGNHTFHQFQDHGPRSRARGTQELFRRRKGLVTASVPENESGKLKLT